MWLAWCVGAVDHDEDPALVAVKGKFFFFNHVSGGQVHDPTVFETTHLIYRKHVADSVEAKASIPRLDVFPRLKTTSLKIKVSQKKCG